MKANNVEVEEIEFLSIHKCEINKYVNKHGRASITGLIKDEDEEKCIKLGSEDNFIHINAINGHEKKCVFCGVIENLELQKGNGKIVKIDLITGTKLLDLVKRTRTFQNNEMSYKAMITSNNSLNTDVRAGTIFYKGEKIPGELVVQYKETDWKFALRIASKCNTCLIPSCKTEGSKFFFGLHEGGVTRKVSNIMNLKIQKATSEFKHIKKMNQYTYFEEDSYYYIFDSREVFEMGDCVDIGMGEKLYVYKIKSAFDGQELLNTYTLKTARGFAELNKYNDTIIGASLQGKVSSVSRDQVKIKLVIDSIYADTGEMFFSYSTIYSSPDGTGWYCMPEIGDDVRLYFPSENETEAYVISAVHQEVGTVKSSSIGDNPPSRTDPDYKSFKNKAGKEILFTPNKIEINNPNHGKIVLDDINGITISTEHSIRFRADRVIEMHSLEDNILVNGATAVCMKQGNSKILLRDEEINMRGAKLKLQEKNE